MSNAVAPIAKVRRIYGHSRVTVTGLFDDKFLQSGEVEKLSPRLGTAQIKFDEPDLNQIGRNIVPITALSLEKYVTSEVVDEAKAAYAKHADQMADYHANRKARDLEAYLKVRNAPSPELTQERLNEEIRFSTPRGDLLRVDTALNSMTCLPNVRIAPSSGVYTIAEAHTLLQALSEAITIATALQIEQEKTAGITA